MGTALWSCPMRPACDSCLLHPSAAVPPSLENKEAPAHYEPSSLILEPQAWPLRSPPPPTSYRLD